MCTDFAWKAVRHENRDAWNIFDWVVPVKFSVPTSHAFEHTGTTEQRPKTEIFRGLRYYTQRPKPKYCEVLGIIPRYLLPHYRNVTATWEIGFNTGIFIRIWSVFDVHNGKNTEIYTDENIFHFLRTLVNIRTLCYSKYCCGFRLFVIVNFWFIF